MRNGSHSWRSTQALTARRRVKATPRCFFADDGPLSGRRRVAVGISRILCPESDEPALVVPLLSSPRYLVEKVQLLLGGVRPSESRVRPVEWMELDGN